MGYHLVFGQQKDSSVVFTTTASYQYWVWLILALAPAVNIACGIAAALDPTTSQDEKRATLWTLAASTLFVALLYLAVLPTTYRVRSDAVLDVQTPLVCHSFSHLASASISIRVFVSWRPRIKFATDLSRRVLVRRYHRGWDVLTSPTDVDGFVAAVEKVIAGTAEPQE